MITFFLIISNFIDVHANKIGDLGEKIAQIFFSRKEKFLVKRIS